MASAVASTSACVLPAVAPLPTRRLDGDRFRIKREDPVVPLHGVRTIVLGDTDTRVPQETSGGRKKRFLCAWPGCGKAYTRPVRLEEHQRSHTGERPFACPQCDAKFARDTHLKAHMRTHASDADKPFVCPEDHCDKRFWTNQHLKAHVDTVHLGHTGKTYDCPHCDKTFRKHRLLSEHLAVVHDEPDVKPLVCSHPGCGKTFKQKHHLKGHEKTHDLSRYACLHPDCASKPFAERQFGVWSALQKHTKTAHPPRCHHPECAGKTFTTSYGLRAHLKLHAADEGDTDGGLSEGRQRRSRKRPRTRGRGRERGKGKARAVKADATTTEEEAVMTEDAEDDDENEGDGDETYEEGSEWEEMQEAERDERMREDFRHGGKKKRKILEEARGFPPILRSAISNIGSPVVKTELDDEFPFPRPPAPAPMLMAAAAPIAGPVSTFYRNLVTGANYAQPASSSTTARSPAPTAPRPAKNGDDRARPGLANLPRQYACPFPAILALPFEDVKVVPPGSDDDDDEFACGGSCRYWFKRVYDVERHLRSRHGIVMLGGRDTLETWYEAQRLEDGTGDET